MVKAIRVYEHGGSDKLTFEDMDLGAPDPGFVTVRIEAAGLNFIDTYFRSGLYPLPLPTSMGVEGAGVVEALGDGVNELAIGDRVAWCSAGIGSYSEAVNLPATRLSKIPDGISTEEAAAMMLKGQTTEYLIQRTYPLKSGETALFHAAAGGVGLIFGQWGKAIGAELIGTVGSDEKAELAKAHGYTHVINYRTENVVERVMEITAGRKLPVVYDGVGKDTWDMSLDCLQPRGLMVSFGNASGPPPLLELHTLNVKGSLYVTRPSMAAYVADTGELQRSAQDLFGFVSSGKIKIDVNQKYALKDTAKAHDDLENRKTTGSTILIP